MLENPNRCLLGRIVKTDVQFCNTHCIRLPVWLSFMPIIEVFTGPILTTRTQKDPSEMDPYPYGPVYHLEFENRYPNSPET